MSVGSVVAKNPVLRIVRAAVVAGGILVSISLTSGSRVRAQSLKNGPPPSVRMPDESAGIDAIVESLISAFDQTDILALGERHGEKLDSDLRIALVRHPGFVKKVRAVVVEFGSTTSQPILDRYIRGENVSKPELERVWKTTTQGANGLGNNPIYAEFFAAVRDVNSKLPAEARIRVLGGDPGPGDSRSRENAAVAVLKDEVLQRHGKALVIYGAAHFYRTMDNAYLSSVGGEIGIVRMLELEYPGRTFAVIPVGGRIDLPPGVTLRVYPDFGKFDRELKTQERPVLLPEQRFPFRDFLAEEFIGSHVLNCAGPGGCRSIFEGSKLTLGQMADALLYVGIDGAPTKTKATQ